jgi:hypothetical protein
MVVTLWLRSPPLPDVPVNGTPPIVGADSVEGNTAIPCVAGTYYGAADAITVFPFGAIPPIGAIGSFSAAIPIVCD